MSLSFVVLILFFVLIILLVVIGQKKGWIVKNPSGIFTAQVAMHDFATRDKQEAMEYVIDGQEEKEKEIPDEGEDMKSGKKGEARFDRSRRDGAG